MQGVGYGAKDMGFSVDMTPLQEQEVAKELKEELLRGEEHGATQSFKYAEIPLEKNKVTEKHNILIVEFLPCLLSQLAQDHLSK
jgi:hypothetical protein